MTTPDTSNWTQVFSQLPPEGLIAAGFGIGVGVLLLAFGSRVLKPAFITAGILLGAAVGLVAAYAIDLPFPEWIVAALGGVGFAIFASLAYRPAMGVAMALLFGTAAPLGVIAYAEFRGHHVITDPDGFAPSEGEESRGATRDALGELSNATRDAIDTLRKADNLLSELRSFRDERAREARQLLGLPPREGEAAPTGGDDGSDDGGADGNVATPAWREKFDAVVAQIKAEAQYRWNAADPGVRRSILLSAASGAIFGFLVGLSLTTLSASAVTSMGGSGLVLISGWSLLTSLGFGDQPWMPSSATAWLIIWLAVAFAGLAIQWTIRRKPADSSR